MRSHVFLFAVCALFGFGRTQDDVDDAIKAVFGGNGTQSAAEDDSCTCVPYYLCNQTTSVIITDGVGLIDIRFNKEGCGSYLEVCCKSPIPADSTDRPILPVNKPTGCGRRNLEGVGFRITGDKDNEAQFGEFPWMVAIFSRDNQMKDSIYQCGGALIHPSVVLTGAHCVACKGKRYKIRAGEWDTQTTNEILPHQDRAVRQVIIHAQYYAGALFNDVALVFLQEPVKIAGNVDVVCLPPQDMLLDRSRCFASGWGKKDFDNEDLNQVILKKIDLPIVDRDECQDKLRKTRLGNHFHLHRSFICAGGEVGKDTCKGDGGSPLVCPVPGQPDRYVQAGIVAWGIGCGGNQVPGVYVNVPSFRDWIDEQMRIQGYDITTYSY